MKCPLSLTSSLLLASPQKGAKKSTYSSKAHHWRSAIGSCGGRGGRAHLGRDVVEAGIGTGAGEGAVHLVVAHHGKGRRIGAGDGDGCAQGRSCKEAGISGRWPSRGVGPTLPFRTEPRPPSSNPLRVSPSTWDPHLHSLRRLKMREVFIFLHRAGHGSPKKGVVPSLTELTTRGGNQRWVS